MLERLQFILGEGLDKGAQDSALLLSLNKTQEDLQETNQQNSIKFC